MEQQGGGLRRLRQRRRHPRGRAAAPRHGKLQIADVRAQVALSLFTDFENFSTFKPGAHQEKAVGTMLDQVVAWSGAMRALRTKAGELQRLAA